MNRTKQPYTAVIQVEGTEYFPETVASSPFSLIPFLLPRFDTPLLPWDNTEEMMDEHKLTASGVVV
jgi:hypothetical protein